MGILDRLKSHFSDGNKTQTEQAAALDRQRKGDQFGDLPEEIEEMPPEDVVDEFARMQQQNRLTFVQNGFISKGKWKDMMDVIEDDPKYRGFWGLDGSQIDIKDGVNVCECHEEVTQILTVTKGNQKMIGQTQGTTKTSKTEGGGKVSGGGEIGVPGIGSMNMTREVSGKKGRTQGQTQQEMAQATGTDSVTQTFHSCRIETTDSPLSRRAFLKTGDAFIRKSYNKTEAENDLIDDWEMDAEHTAEQEQSQKGIDELREERDELDNQIDELDEEIEIVNNRLEENNELSEQNKNNIDKGKESIEKREYLLNERDRLTEKRTNIREKKNDLRTEKNDLQDRIEDHAEYEETQEADTSESTTEDAAETATEDHAAENEPAEATTEPNATEQTTDTDTPEDDGGPPADDGSEDRGGEEETDTVEESPTVEPDAQPTEATADAATDEADQSESESDDDTPDTDATEEPETNEEQKEYANKGELYLDRYDPSNGQTGGFDNSK